MKEVLIIIDKKTDAEVYEIIKSVIERPSCISFEIKDYIEPYGKNNNEVVTA